MKKKIIHIVPTFDIGGVQTGILYSMKELNYSHDYSVLVIGEINNKWIESADESIKKKIIWTGSNSVLKGYINAYQILKKNKPDIIISSLWKSILLSILFKIFNRNTILLGFYHSTKYSHLVDYLLSFSLKFFSDAALADSETTKIVLRKKFYYKKIYTVPFIFKFTPPKLPHKIFNSEHIRLVYFGRISKPKGVFRIIKFCKFCQEIGINFTLDIYGDGDVNQLSSFINEYSLEKNIFIRSLIPLNEVSFEMQNYDFLVQLSDFEGMALTVVEAMSQGLVPIVTPVGEIANYSKDGLNAIWLEADFELNLNRLAIKLKKVVEDNALYYRMSSNATKSFINYKNYCDSMNDVFNSYLVS